MLSRCLAVAVVSVFTGNALLAADAPNLAKTKADADWKIAIVPNAAPKKPGKPGSIAEAYQRAYAAIPFSRALYEVNPTYRHDMAMEFAFGKMRPTVVHKYPMRPLANDPAATRPSLTNPYPAGLRLLSRDKDINRNGFLFPNFPFQGNRFRLTPFFPRGGFQMFPAPLAIP